MRIAAFLSHTIQYFSPLWQELSRRPGVDLKVFYYSRHGLEKSVDRDFGVAMQWDIDLLGGYEHAFLPRQWPTRDPLEYRWKGLNAGIGAALREGWDVAYVVGYIHLNNWRVAGTCRRLGIPLLCQNDVSLITENGKANWKRGIKKVVVGGFFRQVSGFLAVGDHSRDYFMHYGASPEAVTFCPYVVDVERFRGAAEAVGPSERNALRDKYRIPRDKRLVLFCGKLIDRKRPLDLVAALRQLRRQDVVGVFIGEGELRAEIERAGGRDVVVTGFVNQREMPALLSLGELQVLPSSYEAYGIVVGEGMAVGVPAVVSDRCGCHGPHGVLRDNESGLLYRCGNTDDLAAKIAYVLDHPAERQRMSERGRGLAEIMSPKRVADNFLAAARKAASGTA